MVRRVVPLHQCDEGGVHVLFCSFLTTHCYALFSTVCFIFVSRRVQTAFCTPPADFCFFCAPREQEKKIS